jgi:hypothetical protein
MISFLLFRFDCKNNKKNSTTFLNERLFLVVHFSLSFPFLIVIYKNCRYLYCWFSCELFVPLPFLFLFSYVHNDEQVHSSFPLSFVRFLLFFLFFFLVNLHIRISDRFDFSSTRMLGRIVDISMTIKQKKRK